MADCESPVKGLSEEATCPLCLDYFKDPMSIDCGHSFCQACLTKWWGVSGEEVSCPQCRERIQKRTFRPNRPLANMTKLLQDLQRGKKEEEEKKGVCKLHQEPLKLFCKDEEAPICVVCDRSKKHQGHRVFPLEEAAQEYKKTTKLHLESLREKTKELKGQKHFQELRKQDYQTQLELEKMKIKSLFERMQRFLEEKQHHCLAQLEGLEKEVEKQQEKTLTSLSEDIFRLSLLITEMEEKCLQPASEFLQDIRNSLMRCEKNLVDCVVDVSPHLEKRLGIISQKTSALQKATEFYKENLEQTLITAIWEQTVNTGNYPTLKEKVPELRNETALCTNPGSPLMEFIQVNVTLDPETAHPRLLLSQDRKNVRMLKWAQQLPANPERFDKEAFVLGCERFTSGRHCWEVGVGSTHMWAVGISRDSVRRKGNIVPNPEEGIWVVGQGEQPPLYTPIFAFTHSGITPLTVDIGQYKIYVALDYEKGCVEFFKANTKEFIFGYYSIPFSGEGVRPFFHVPSSGTLKCC